jgi:hypothetical protein
MLSVANNWPSPLLFFAAFCNVWKPFAPFADETIDRTVMCVALLFMEQWPFAWFTTVCWVSDNSPLAPMGTCTNMRVTKFGALSSALFRAIIKFTPSRK